MTDAANDLVLTRVLDAPRDKVWRCWVEPELLKQWFCPKPWYVSEARIGLRPGGAEARKEHEDMGFHEGWGKAADQLDSPGHCKS